jgi:hypothetical protein
MPTLGNTPPPQKAITAFDKYRAKGFTELSKPEEVQPTMPLQLSNLNADALGDLMSKYSRWREYAEDLYLKAYYEYTVLNEKYEHSVAVFKVQANTSKKFEKDDLVKADRSLRALADKVLEAQMYYELLSSKVDSLDKSFNTLSREISRRSSSNNRF